MKDASIHPSKAASFIRQQIAVSKRWRSRG